MESIGPMGPAPGARGPSRDAAGTRPSPAICYPWAMRAVVAAGYTFAAWLFAGFCIDAGYRVVLARPGRVVVHCGAVLCCFIPVFRLYFERPDRLPPAATAALAIAFIVVLDIAIVGPYFAHRYDFFLSFWDWQLPGFLVASSIYLSGRQAIRR